MLKHYCPECGNPTNYALNKPKFCSSCGLNFDTKDNLNSKSSAIVNKTKKLIFLIKKMTLMTTTV